jgi:hypothetical protein
MHTADVIATAAAIISLCSVAVAIGALRIQRHHDRKSVQPIPQIILGDYENCIYVAIENAGVGPYVIQSFAVENVMSKITKASVVELLPRLPAGFYWTTFIEKLEQRAIPAQQKLVLLQLDEPKEGSGFANVRQQMRNELGHLRITVSGKDIYGNPMSDCSRLLDYFHRTYLGFLDSPKKLS